MCGIFCLLSFVKEHNTSHLHEEFQLYKQNIIRRGPNSMKTQLYKLSDCDVLFAASVLWLQGKDITEQPVQDSNFALIYNGDVFGGIISEDKRINMGDTKPLFDALNNSNIQHLLNNVEGPYACVYLNIFENKIYFGRDRYGRRSLLISRGDNKIIITSVAKKRTKLDFLELPSIGTFYIDLCTKNWHILPWKTRNKNFAEKLSELEVFIHKRIIIENYVCDEEQNKYISPSEIQLHLVKEIEQLGDNNIFEFLCSNSFWLDKIVKLKSLLQNSLQKRLSAQPEFCQNCFKKYECDHSLIGILFSGGVDCAILTLLADRFIDKKRPIDLINVAFEDSSNYKTPDRITGMATLSELQRLCPHRIWNFVEVNVSKRELDSCRSERISDLIYPLKSVLDDSLGCALWFASRAKTENYISPCRVLLVGMGADELFGGYTRHRAALQKRGWEGLHLALEEDWQNLPYRNLARDDRVVSDHGRQLRTPYLDENVVDFVRSLNCWEKTLPSNNLAKGIGDKILLRSLAHYLGLTNAAKLAKRALQFGCKIANSKEKAHEVSLRLLT